MIYEDLKTIDYGKAWEYQQELFARTINHKTNNLQTENRLLFCEHPHTLTIGKHGDKGNLLFNEQYLSEKKVALYQIDRGGDITYHGPGQIVGYPIFDLDSYGIGLRHHIYNMEEAIIRFLETYNIKSERLEGAAGVWLDTTEPRRTRKIAAIGVRSSRFVTMHGFALNVNTDLSYFSLINPCGFVDKGVTSMQKELGKDIDIEKAKLELKEIFESLFVEK